MPDDGSLVAGRPINGYDPSKLYRYYFDQLCRFTPSAISEKIDVFSLNLDHSPANEPAFISIGENCAAATRMKHAGMDGLGSGFFDYLVINIASFTKLVDADFSDILCLRNLSVREWEGADSVYDELYGTFYHHHFHLRYEDEKSDFSSGARRRRIDEEDIPLFLSAVRSQFEYLALKFRIVMRSSKRKVLVLRRVHGEPVEMEQLEEVRKALRRFGSRNTSVACVHSVQLTSKTDYSNHFFIPEDGARWGDGLAWRGLIDFTQSKAFEEGI